MKKVSFMVIGFMVAVLFASCGKSELAGTWWRDESMPTYSGSLPTMWIFPSDGKKMQIAGTAAQGIYDFKYKNGKGTISSTPQISFEIKNDMIITDNYILYKLSDEEIEVLKGNRQ
jgi:hypothetical protein